MVIGHKSGKSGHCSCLLACNCYAILISCCTVQEPLGSLFRQLMSPLHLLQDNLAFSWTSFKTLVKTVHTVFFFFIQGLPGNKGEKVWFDHYSYFFFLACDVLGLHVRSKISICFDPFGCTVFPLYRGSPFLLGSNLVRVLLYRGTLR